MQLYSARNHYRKLPDRDSCSLEAWENGLEAWEAGFQRLDWKVCKLTRSTPEEVGGFPGNQGKPWKGLDVEGHIGATAVTHHYHSGMYKAESWYNTQG